MSQNLTAVLFFALHFCSSSVVLLISFATFVVQAAVKPKQLIYETTNCYHESTRVLSLLRDFICKRICNLREEIDIVGVVFS